MEYIIGELFQRNWILGGHSRGGKLATLFVNDNSKALRGLLPVGTSHPREIDLTDLTLDVTKIYGYNDGLASEEEINKFSVYLPVNTYYKEIEGGNHRQFTYYGFQFGDILAGISRQKQQNNMIDAIIKQLERVQANYKF